MGRLWLHAAVNPLTGEKLPLCIIQFLNNYKYFGFLKGANEVNRVFPARCAIMLAKSAVLCWNMLLCCTYHNAQNYAGIIRKGLSHMHVETGIPL